MKLQMLLRRLRKRIKRNCRKHNILLVLLFIGVCFVIKKELLDPLDVKILEAIDSPKYKARTLEGVAAELRVGVEDVRRHIRGKALSQKIVQVPGVRKENKPIYVTVERYKKKTPLSVRILNMVSKDNSDD